MSEGKKFDKEKIRMDLIPPDALYAVAEVWTFGAKKYDDRNWEKGMAWGRLFGAAMRHLWSYWMGEDNDTETELPHLAHAGCCVMMLLSFQLRKHGTDDRNKLKEQK